MEFTGLKGLGADVSSAYLVKGSAPRHCIDIYPEVLEAGKTRNKSGAFPYW